MSTAAERYEDMLIKRFMQRSTEEILKLLDEDRPLKDWFIKQRSKINKKTKTLCPDCKHPTHVCEHGVVVHSDAPLGTCYWHICHMQPFVPNAPIIEGVNNDTPNRNTNRKEDNR